MTVPALCQIPETPVLELPIGIDETICLALSDIIYVDSVKTVAHSICYHTFNGSEITVRDTIEHALKLLGTGFIRCHRSIIEQNIEKYFPCFSALILFLFILILVPFTVLQLHNILIMLLLPCLCLAILYAQLPFVILLFKVAFYKDAATYQQWEKEEISSYYQTLSSSLSDMQGMRHDIKNIFFTMGIL
ncbi:MAG: LytTR family transcriptional regulator [Kineothrix sp.]|nr:LytTR family transcriptional regulator [Kineothrix sp.]